MKLAFSNIAWLPRQRDAAYAILKENGIRGLEIAPGLFLADAKDAFQPSLAECEAALAPMGAAGLELVSMQSLLFGVEHAALFGDRSERDGFERAMTRAIRLAGLLGIPNMVFGSPRQRNIPAEMAREEAERIALDVFRRLGDIAAAEGTILGLEINPRAYGTNFLTDAEETAVFVSKVSHPAIKMILDVGAMHLNDDFDGLASFVAKYVTMICHVHLSEPYLAPAPAHASQAGAVLGALSSMGYQRWYSVEMKAVPGRELEAVERSVARLKQGVDSIHAGASR